MSLLVLATPLCELLSNLTCQILATVQAMKNCPQLYHKTQSNTNTISKASKPFSTITPHHLACVNQFKLTYRTIININFNYITALFISVCDVYQFMSILKFSKAILWLLSMLENSFVGIQNGIHQQYCKVCIFANKLNLYVDVRMYF